MDELEKLKLELDARGFSSKTKKSCIFFVKDFLGHAKKEPSKIHKDDIKEYLSY